MKKIQNHLFLLFIIVAVFASCKKDEQKIYYEEGVAPVLSASSSGALVLLKEEKDDPAITLSWTNPDYLFTTGPSSQDVTYILQVDQAGKNFASANKQEMSISRNVGVTLSVKDLNSFLVKMELEAGVAYDIEMRIKATLANGRLPLLSNVIQVSVTPYLDFAVEPPGTLANNYADGELWALGDAFASGWDNPMKAPYTSTQKFTKIDLLHYVDTITFKATGGYKLIQQQGNWDTQYHALDGTVKLDGLFEKKNSDPQFPTPGAGDYKVEINFQTGRYKLTKLP